MAISRKSAAEFAQDLENSISSRNSEYDTRVGPIADVYIQPTANVLELQNERIRRVQQLLALTNDGSFTDDDLDAFVYNEAIVRLSGSRASVTLTFSRSTAPTSNITVRANFPVGTLADEQTGTSITFMTIEDATLVVANASSYFNSDTQRYELNVQAEAVVGTSAGNVGPYRVIRALRPLNGFDSVFNRSSSSGGNDRETNAQLIERYFISLMGTSPAVVSGIRKIVMNKFSQVEDSNVVYGNNPLNIRASSDGGAVDVYVIGNTPVTTTETIVFTGADQPIRLSKQPVSAILSAGAYMQGADFTLFKDSSGYANSVKAYDGIKWLSSGVMPAVGSPIVVSYMYNGLIQQLQNEFTLDENVVPGRDLLYKEATRVDVSIAANIRIRSGFNVASVVSIISTSLVNYINSLRLGDSVEQSDLQLIVRAYSGVDNLIITTLSRAGTIGVADVTIGANEYARVDASSIAITVI